LQRLCGAPHQSTHDFVPIQRNSGDFVRPVRSLTRVSAVPIVAALLLLALPAQAGAAWRPPVPGPVAQRFDLGRDPFEGGRHRGIDLLARPGATVRAPCGGRVVVAGRIGRSGGVVTVLCGAWRVSHLPLAAIAVRERARVATGARLGTLARGHAHAGLHVGVRRDGERFGYVDPLRFFGVDPAAPPLGRAPRAPRRRPAPPPRLVVARPPAVGARLPAVVAGPGAAAVTDRGIAPWPAGAGLALVLAGVGVRWRDTIGNRTRRRIRASVRLNA
jgi:hypothetical protein